MSNEHKRATPNIVSLLDDATDKWNLAQHNSLKEAYAYVYRKGVLDTLEACGYNKEQLLSYQNVRQHLMGNGDRLLNGGLWMDKDVRGNR